MTGLPKTAGKTYKAWGGSREGSGSRPRVYDDPMDRVSVTIRPTDEEYMRTLVPGNFSAAVRLLIARSQGKEPPAPESRMKRRGTAEAPDPSKMARKHTITLSQDDAAYLWRLGGQNMSAGLRLLIDRAQGVTSSKPTTLPRRRRSQKQKPHKPAPPLLIPYDVAGYRARSALSKTALAAVLNVNWRTVHRWETRGMAPPKAVKVMRRNDPLLT